MNPSSSATRSVTSSPPGVRRDGIVLAFILGCVVYGFAYTLHVRRNIIVENQFAYMPLLQKVEDGTLTLADLWTPFGEHRVLGYKILFIGNALLFQLNSLMEALLMPLTFGVGAWILFLGYRKSLEGLAGDRFVQLSFLPMALLFNAPSQYATFANGMIVGLAIGATLFVATFLVLDRYLRTPSRVGLATYAVAVVFTVLVFGSAYSTGFAAAVLAGAGAASYARWRESGALPWRHALSVAIPLLGAMIVYMIPWAGSPVRNADLSQNVGWVLTHAFGSLRFVCLMMAATVFSDVVHQQHENHAGVLALFGLLVALSYAAALRVFVRERSWRITWVPFLFIVHACATMGSVLLGRSRYGEGYASFQQYLLQTKLGTIGAIWTFVIYARSSPGVAARRWMAVPVIAALCQLYSIGSEWRIAGYRRELFENGLNATLNGDQGLLRVPSGQQLNLLMAEPGETEVGLRIARHQKLSAFSACPKPGRSLQDALLLSGWHAQEGGGRWIQSTARIQLHTGTRGHIALEGYVPPEIHEKVYGGDLQVILRSGTQELVRNAVGPGSFAVEATVCTECDFTLTIEMTKSFVPSAAGLGADDRQLSVVVTKLDAD